MTTLRIALAALLVGGCSGGGSAPRAAPAPALPAGRLIAPPVHALLGYRDRLELTSPQVAALDSIGEWLREANGPVLAQVDYADDAGDERRRATGAPPRRADEGTLAQLMLAGENNAAAVSGVQALLSDEQERKVCELFTREEETRRGVLGRRVTRDGSPAGAPRPSPWSWCAPSAG